MIIRHHAGVFAVTFAVTACVGDPPPVSRSAADPSNPQAPEAPFDPPSDPLRNDAAAEAAPPMPMPSGHHHGSAP